ncbi:MAG: glycosyltransferase [Actinomycetaceae bacterium]|nr:glycosyltransferase [Actinomycetaceae bacterium]
MMLTLATRLFLPEPAAAALRLGALAREFGEHRGIRTKVLTSRFKAEPPTIKNVYIRRFPVLRDSTGAVRGYLQYMSFDIPLFFRMLFTDLGEGVICEPPPTTGVVTRLACTIKRTPYVYFAGDIVSDAAEGTGAPEPVIRTVRAMERFAISGAAGVVAVTDGVAKRAHELGAKRVNTVPNGIDTSPGAMQKPEHYADKEVIFLYAGNVAPWLGADRFIKAMPQVRETIPNSHLVFLGQGAAWDDLQDLARDMGEQATFVPAVSPDEAKDWYRYATVGLASLREGIYDYAYPTKILACLSQGTPVVYVGGGEAARDIRENDLGAVSTFDVDVIAEAMVRVAQQAEQEGAHGSERLTAWVEQNRSVKRSAHDVASTVLGFIE